MQSTFPPTFWTKLIDPPSTLTDPQQRYQAQLLALLSPALPLLLIALPLHQWSLFGFPNAALTMLALIGLAAILYALNHAGKYRLAAYVAALIFLGVSLYPQVGALPGDDLETAFYLACLIFFSAVFIGWRNTLILTLIDLALHYQAIITPLFTVTIFVVALWAYGAYRDRLAQLSTVELRDMLDALRRREEHFNAISRLMADFAYSIHINVDKTLSNDWISGSFKPLTGYFPQELLDEKVTDPQLQADMAALLAGNVVSREYSQIDTNGDTRWIQLYRYPIWDSAQQRVVRYYAVAQDITARKQAEASLANERNLLRTLIDHIPDHIYVKDRQGRFLLANAAALKSIGLEREEQIIGKSNGDFFPTDRAEQWHAQEMSIMGSGVAVREAETFQPWNANLRRWVVDSLIPLRDDDGEVIGLIGLSRDVTERKRAEESLRESEAKFRTIFEIAPTPITIATAAGRLVDANQAFRDLVAMPLDALIGHGPIELRLVRDQETIKRLVDFTQERRPRTNLDITIHSADGNAHSLLYSIQPLELDGQPHLLTIGQDITERKRTEQREHAVARNMRAVVEAADELIGIPDLDTFYRRAVELGREKLKLERCGLFLLDASKERLQGTYGTDSHRQTTDERWINGPLRERSRNLLTHSVKTWELGEEELVDLDPEHPHSLGKSWIVATPIRVGGEIIGVFSNDTGITHAPLDPVQQEALALYCSLVGNILARRRIEDELRASEESARRFQDALKTLHQVNLELTQAESVDDLCRRAVELGRSHLDFDRLGLWLYDPHTESVHGTYGTDESGATTDEHDLFHPITSAPLAVMLLYGGKQVIVDNAINLLMPNHEQRQIPGWHLHASMWSGSWIIGYLSADNLIRQRPFYPYQAELLSLFATMIGHLYARKEIESAERAQREFAEALRDTASAISSTLNLKEVLNSILASLGHIMNHDAATIMLIDNDAAQVVCAHGYAERGLGESILMARLPLATTANLRNMLATQKPLVIPRVEEFEDWHVNSLTTWIKSELGAPIQIEGQTIGFLSLDSATPDTFKAEDVARLEAFADQAATAIRNARLYDTVIRYADELELRVEERTSQYQAANQELEAFAYSVSHDLRAPLRAMDGFARTLIQNYSATLPDKGQHYLNRIQQNAQRMGLLIDDLLTLSRVGRKEVKKESVSVNALLKRLLGELSLDNQIGAAEIVVADLPPCHADETLLRQVWFNLVTNAIKYSRKKEHPRIEIGYQPGSDAAGCYFIRDNGVGFDMRYVDKLFGVFQRLHNVQEYDGTGIGLAIVKRIINRHGGQVWAEAEIDQGATFYFTLP